jgi:hypothetical protein
MRSDIGDVYDPGVVWLGMLEPPLKLVRSYLRGLAHLRELLFNMGTVAFQTMVSWTKKPPADQAPAPLGG